ncbi:DUF6953 family protein [Bradyrhizobium diazoefficiens]
MLYQDTIVDEIHERFGPDSTRENDRGNLGIHPDVLKAFRALTPDAVWDRNERCWRLRDQSDAPGRMQE